MTDLPRDHLVNGNSGADIRRALFHPHARQESAIRSGVIARPIWSRLGVFVIQPAHDLDVLSGRFQW